MPDIKAFMVPQEMLILSAAVDTGIIEKLKDKPMSSGDLAEGAGEFSLHGDHAVDQSAGLELENAGFHAQQRRFQDQLVTGFDRPLEAHPLHAGKVIDLVFCGAGVHGVESQQGGGLSVASRTQRESTEFGVQTTTTAAAFLSAAVIWQESGGDPAAYSHSGAVGLMQVMPRDGIAAAFMCPNGPCFANRPAITELEDPEFNISYGVGMLAGLYQRYGDLRQALKAYGPMDVGYSYADTVLGLYQQYRKN